MVNTRSYVKGVTMPFRFKVSLSAEFIAQDVLVGELQRNLRRLLRDAAALFYTTLIHLIPVDTGFLAGSLDAIRQATGSSAGPGPPSNNQRRNIYTHFGDRHIVKTPEAGHEFMTDVNNILTEITGPDEALFIFEFTNEVRYYPINDLHGTKFRPAWHYTERAVKAALKFIELNLPKIVDEALNVSVTQQLISFPPNGGPVKINLRR